MDLVGQRLKFLREKAHLTQAKMAELLGASQPAVNRYEHGQTAGQAIQIQTRPYQRSRDAEICGDVL